jgi:hypothetical protein
MTAKNDDFKHPIDRRPPRRSLGAAEAAAKTFGVVTYTASNAPKAPRCLEPNTDELAVAAAVRSRPLQ